MHADAAQKERGAIEQNIAAACFNRTETDPLFSADPSL